MKQKRILIPTKNAITWKQLLADPRKHWKSGFSAKSTAISWENANGLPAEISSIFKTAENNKFHDLSLAIAIPEYKVELAGGSRPSQNDVFALLTFPGGLISMMVEGKAKEDFDLPIIEWKKKTSEQGAKARLEHIAENIGLNKPIPDHIRYQLLHRAASAVIEANRFHAKYAVLLIQSFVKNDAENHYDDFCKFIDLYNKTPEKDSLIELSKPHDIELFAAWVHSKPK